MKPRSVNVLVGLFFVAQAHAKRPVYQTAFAIHGGHFEVLDKRRFHFDMLEEKAHSSSSALLSLTSSAMHLEGNRSDASWERVCGIELGRTPAHASTLEYPVRGHDRSSDANTIVDRLNALFVQRGTFGTRARAHLSNASSGTIQACLNFEKPTRMCEVAPFGGSFVVKKGCLAPSQCYSFNVPAIHQYILEKNDKARKPHCSVALSGHTLHCNKKALSMADLVQFRRLGHDERDIAAIRAGLGIGHTGGSFLGHTLEECRNVDVYGMGMFSDAQGDFMYQHHYDELFADSCNYPCWDGSGSLGTVEDRRFWKVNSHKVCTMETRCASAHDGMEGSEAQTDFFIMSELRLHVLHAFGAINWVWY